MIKVQATINGIISKPATIRVSGDGKKFIGFLVKLSVPGSRNNMPGKELSISVSKDGDESELPSLAAGTRIEATGTLTFRKTGDNPIPSFARTRRRGTSGLIEQCKVTTHTTD